MKGLELLDGFEPVFIENPHKNSDNIQEITQLCCGSNIPACGGTIYSNTFWLPEDEETLLDDLRNGILGG